MILTIYFIPNVHFLHPRDLILANIFAEKYTVMFD